jgi:hypothetical protein
MNRRLDNQCYLDSPQYLILFDRAYEAGTRVRLPCRVPLESLIHWLPSHWTWNQPIYPQIACGLTRAKAVIAGHRPMI